jgi:glycosyltransferase involved in cell wall biosynthesis
MNRSRSPRISILMPVYNVQDYVREAVESILNQTYTDFELLILDDCSTDKTANIISQFQDKRIRYHRNETNLGLSENLNGGIRMSKGEFLARMDGDDISMPTRLEKQVEILDKYPEIGICGTSFQFFGTRHDTIIQPKQHDDIKIKMLFGCVVTLVVMRKEIFIDNDLWYRTDAFPAEDYKMWADCLHVTKICNLSEVLFLYRMHEAQISTSKAIAQKQKSDRVRLEMLDWLSPDFTEEDKVFFCEQFVPGLMNLETEYIKFQRFEKKMLDENEKLRNFNSILLQKQLQKQIQTTFLKFVIEKYFNNGYAYKYYIPYLRSRLIMKVSIKNNIKFLLKSILLPIRNR